MKDIFTIELSEELFEKVASGKKTIHLEINDKQHKILAVGNQLTFICKTEEETKSQKAVIETLLYFGNIKEAIETLGKEPCGFKPSATIEKASDVFMIGENYENIEKYGIVAMVFQNIE